MSQLGVASHKFDEIGEFTYCLLLQVTRIEFPSLGAVLLLWRGLQR